MPKTEGLLERLSRAAKAGDTWDVLVLAALEGASAACHHHPYELAPSVGELQVLLASVGELHEVVTATAGSQE